MQKVTILTRQSSFQGGSCRSIATNLDVCYKLSENVEVKSFYLDRQDSIYLGKRLALEAGLQPAIREADVVKSMSHSFEVTQKKVR